MCEEQREVDRLRAEIERLRAIVLDACEVLNHYGLPEHAFHYRRVLNKEVPLTVRSQLISATS